MKIPKGFGNFGSMMKQAQEAMQRAQQMEEDLKLEEITVDKNGVQVKLNGAGEILSIKLEPEIVDVNDIESLEDTLVIALREGFEKAGELRQKRVQEITANIPLPPGLGG